MREETEIERNRQTETDTQRDSERHWNQKARER